MRGTPICALAAALRRCAARLGIGAALALSAACSPPEPVRIGFIGNISGRGADLGIGGRNGVQLAIEQRNAAGGIGGQMVELLVRDDGGDPEHARRVLRELVAAGVALVIGPMTSGIAVAIAPEAERAGVVLLSPTATTNELADQDDHFFRIVGPTRDFASASARHLREHLGIGTLAVAYDARNLAYTASWLSDFRRTFEALGGTIGSVHTFESSDTERFLPIAGRLLAGMPDGILILANSLDAALIAQQVRKLDARVPLASSEWAATERLTEIGGKAVEGMSLASFLDEQNAAPAYLEFRRAYRERFGNPPSFSGLTGFDAANTALDALQRRRRGQALRDFFREHPEVPAAQGGYRFRAGGDGERPTYIMTIRDGRFVRYLPAS